MRIYQCRGCGGPIIRIETAGGKSIPCDPEQVIYWQESGGKQKIVTPNGEVVSASLEGDSRQATGMAALSGSA